METEDIWRISVFVGVLAFVALWEALWPRRSQRVSKQIRWPRNLSLIIIDNIMIRLFVPVTAAAAAIWSANANFGIFHFIGLNNFVAIILSVILLDLLIYWQHVIFHRVPMLWQLHKLHHVDQDIDVTTGIRFHPVEIILSAFIKCIAVVILGVPFLGIVIFEIVLNAAAMFNHGNIKLPLALDRVLRIFIVTPDMHRVHHSTMPNETHSNFGFNLSLWDRFFNTYIDQPKLGHDEMQIGLPQYQDETKTGLIQLLTMPFRRK